MMRGFQAALATAAALACAGAATAEVAGSGYVTLRGARNKIKILGADETTTSYGAEGAIVFQPAGARYNIQLNGSVDQWDTNLPTYDEDGDPYFVYLDSGDPVVFGDSEIVNADAHLFWGRPDVYTAGGFVSILEYDLYGLVNETIYGGGVEFDVHSAQSTGSVQAGLFLSEEDYEIYAASGQARYYPIPAFSLEGSAAYGAVDSDYVDGGVYGVGLEAEFQFENTPFSVFAGARYSKTDEYDLEDRALVFGGRWNFGTRTLLERDRTGASMRGSQKINELLAVPLILQPVVALFEP